MIEMEPLQTDVASDYLAEDHLKGFIAGAIFATHRQTVRRVTEAVMKTAKEYIDRGKFGGEDQLVMVTTCLRNPGLCAVVQPMETTRLEDFDGELTWYGMQLILNFENAAPKCRII